MPFDNTEPVIAAETKPAVPQMPEFRRQWWHSRSRIDIRPALWSLYNRPEEWQTDGEYTIKHVPSAHEFWIANGFSFYGLYASPDRPRCSCTHVREGKFSLLQKVQFALAYHTWRCQHRSNIEQINAQFRSHFDRSAL